MYIKPVFVEKLGEDFYLSVFGDTSFESVNCNFPIVYLYYFNTVCLSVVGARNSYFCSSYDINV